MVKELIQGKTNISEAARQHEQTPSDTQSWLDDAMRGMENALQAKPRDIGEQSFKKVSCPHASGRKFARLSV